MNSLNKIQASLVAGLLLISWSLPVSAQTISVQTKESVMVNIANDTSEVIALGDRLDPQSGKLATGYAIIYKREDNNATARAIDPNSPGNKRCNKYIRNGAKWKHNELWLVNPQNSRGLDEQFIFSNLGSNIAKWEDATDGAINQFGLDIMGDGQMTNQQLSADMTGPDGQNEVYFASLPNSKTVAITFVWGYLKGSTKNRELLEWDQIYNQTDYDWSGSGETGKMDFESVATHEIGHAFGLADLYTSRCTGETMYGHVSLGQTNKRVLKLGDIVGINELY